MLDIAEIQKEMKRTIQDLDVLKDMVDEMATLVVEDRLRAKIGSILVHCDELLESPSTVNLDHAAQMDCGSIRGLLQDREIRQFIETIDPAMLPVKRERRMR